MASSSRVRGDDPNFSKHVEIFIDDSLDNNDSDNEDIFEIESEHSSDSEQEEDENSVPEEEHSDDDRVENGGGDNNKDKYFYGKKTVSNGGKINHLQTYGQDVII